MRDEAMARSRQMRGLVVLAALASFAAPMWVGDARADAILTTTGDPVFEQSAGDGDAYMEIGEEWKVAVELGNSGDFDATAISAVLTSSTPGIVVLSGETTYANISPMTAASNQSQLVFAVSDDVPCGAVVAFTLTVTFSGGALPQQTFDFTGKVGSPGTPVTFSYADAPVAIPDGADLSGSNPGAPVHADATVSGVTGNVYDVNLSIDGSACSAGIGATTVGIDHTFVNDLDITLIGPDASNVLVIDNTDGSGNNLCQVVLDDDAEAASIQSVVSANAPFVGTYTPANPLTAFDGTAPNGTWQLQAQDFYSQDTGSIRADPLVVTPAVCDASPVGPDLRATKTVAGLVHRREHRHVHDHARERRRRHAARCDRRRAQRHAACRPDARHADGDDRHDLGPWCEPRDLERCARCGRNGDDHDPRDHQCGHGRHDDLEPGGHGLRLRSRRYERVDPPERRSRRGARRCDLVRSRRSESGRSWWPRRARRPRRSGRWRQRYREDAARGRSCSSRRRTASKRWCSSASDPAVASASPCETDGELAIEATGVGGAMKSFPLAASGWKPLNKKKPAKGCKYSQSGGPAVMVKPGKLIKVKTKGDRGVPLTTDPRPVRIELRHGTNRHCMEFGGDGKSVADKKLLSKSSAAPHECPEAR